MPLHCAYSDHPTGCLTSSQAFLVRGTGGASQNIPLLWLGRATYTATPLEEETTLVSPSYPREQTSLWALLFSRSMPQEGAAFCKIFVRAQHNTSHLPTKLQRHINCAVSHSVYNHGSKLKWARAWIQSLACGCLCCFTAGVLIGTLLACANWPRQCQGMFWGIAQARDFSQQAVLRRLLCAHSKTAYLSDCKLCNLPAGLEEPWSGLFASRDTLRPGLSGKCHNYCCGYLH